MKASLRMYSLKTMTVFQCTGIQDLTVNNCHKVTKFGRGWSSLLFPQRDAMLPGGSLFTTLLKIKTPETVIKSKYQ